MTSSFSDLPCLSSDSSFSVLFVFKTKEQMEMEIMLQQMACKQECLSNGDFHFPVLIPLDQLCFKNPVMDISR